MITELEYLKALEVVKAYQKQVNEQVSTASLQEKVIGDLDLPPRIYNRIYSLFKDNGKEEIKKFACDIRNIKVKTLVETFSSAEIMHKKHLGASSLLRLEREIEKCGFKLK